MSIFAFWRLQLAISCHKISAHKWFNQLLRKSSSLKGLFLFFSFCLYFWGNDYLFNIFDILLKISFLFVSVNHEDLLKKWGWHDNVDLAVVSSMHHIFHKIPKPASGCRLIKSCTSINKTEHRDGKVCVRVLFFHPVNQLIPFLPMHDLANSISYFLIFRDLIQAFDGSFTLLISIRKLILIQNVKSHIFQNE